MAIEVEGATTSIVPDAEVITDNPVADTAIATATDTVEAGLDVLENGGSGLFETSIPDFGALGGQLAEVHSRDVDTERAIDVLEERITAGAEISGEEMLEALQSIRDADNQAAHNEYIAFAKFVEQNREHLSKDAMDIFEMYEDVALAQDTTSIPTAELDALFDKMEAHVQPDTYRDKHAVKVMDGLRDRLAAGEELSPEEMGKAIIEATQDKDGSAAGGEFKAVQDFIIEHGGELSPEAREMVRIYYKYVGKANSEGMKGMQQSDYDAMKLEMFPPEPEPEAPEALVQADTEHGAAGFDGYGPQGTGAGAAAAGGEPTTQGTGAQGASPADVARAAGEHGAAGIDPQGTQGTGTGANAGGAAAAAAAANAERLTKKDDELT